MLQADFKRDLHNHYLIVQNEVQENQYSFRLKMLLNNKIPGLLNLDIRVEDNINRYFYDITSKQPITSIFEKSLLSYIQVKKVIKGILQSLELGNGFLLNEDDFVLNPAYIYLQLTNFEVFLCYIADYNRDIREQFAEFIEYLMDKVDYTDDKAVLLVYGLYKLSRDKNFTFDRINEILEKDKIRSEQKSEEMEQSNERLVEDKLQSMQVQSAITKSKQKKVEDKLDQLKKVDIKEQEDKENRDKEKRDKEKRDKGYSKKALGMAVLLMISSILLIVVIAQMGILNNERGTRLDYKKAIAFLIMIGGIEAYLLNLLFKKFDDIDPSLVEKTKDGSGIYDGFKGVYKKDTRDELKREDHNKAVPYNHQSDINYNQGKEVSKEVSKDDYIVKGNDNTKEIYLINSEETSLLKEFTFQAGYKLTSSNRLDYQDIQIREFPFILGKLRSNVDCVIENNKISRIHARIEEVQAHIYITDLNSTNGTYVNNKRLELNEKRQLEIGDEIRLANVSYCFCKV